MLRIGLTRILTLLNNAERERGMKKLAFFGIMTSVSIMTGAALADSAVLTTQGYVDDATTGMATTTGVTKTIAATTITVPIYGTWGTDTGNGATTDVTATVTEPTYTLN